MAKNKTPPKPISETRFEFADSLENLVQTGTALYLAVQAAIDLGAFPNPSPLITNRMKAFRDALSGSD